MGLFTPVDEATRVLDLHMCGREVDSGAGTRTGVVTYRYVYSIVILRKDGEGCGNGARGALGWRYTHPVLVSAPQGRWLPSLSGVYTYVART